MGQPSAESPESPDASEAPGHPEIVRITAPNPGPMTLSGTNTYVVGSSPAWVVDPGPADAAHIAEVRDVAESRGGIGGVVLTHSHIDHNEGVGMLGAGLDFGNAEGFDDLAALLGTDPTEKPGALGSAGGEEVGPFLALSTPGHATDHVVFVLGDSHPRTRSRGGGEVVCFCGDLVLGEGSTIVPPAAGGGSLLDYMDSLGRIAALGASLMCPGHGPWITEPGAKIEEYASHRRERERLLLGALDAGKRSHDDLLDVAWYDVPSSMRLAAGLAMRSHLEKLDAEDRLPADLEW